jgi:hypothetical protein
MFLVKNAALNLLLSGPHHDSKSCSNSVPCSRGDGFTFTINKDCTLMQKKIGHKSERNDVCLAICTADCAVLIVRSHSISCAEDGVFLQKPSGIFGIWAPI